MEDLSRRLADPLTAPDEIADLRDALLSRVSAGTDDLRRQLYEVRSREHAGSNARYTVNRTAARPIADN